MQLEKLPRESRQFVKAILPLGEDELKAYIRKEKSPWYLKRLYARYNKLRGKRELNKLLEKLKNVGSNNKPIVGGTAKKSRTTGKRKSPVNRTRKNGSKKG